MGKLEIIVQKLRDHKAILKFSELEFFLKHNGYEEKKTGKTSGSRKAYLNISNGHIIRLHKPHPGNEIKKYMKEALVKEFIKLELL